MGIYIYTVRADTKVIDGMRIGRFAYAYKEVGFPTTKERNRQALYHRQAESSRYKVKDVDYFILGEFAYATEEPLAVLKVDRDVESYYDTGKLGEVVGHIRKIGGRYTYKPLPISVAA